MGNSTSNEINLISKLKIDKKDDKVNLLYNEAKRTGILLVNKEKDIVLVPYETTVDDSSVKAFVYTTKGQFYPRLYMDGKTFKYNLIVLYLVKIDGKFHVRHIGKDIEEKRGETDLHNLLMYIQQVCYNSVFVLKDPPPVYKEETVEKPPSYETASAPEK